MVVENEHYVLNEMFLYLVNFTQTQTESNVAHTSENQDYIFILIDQILYKD